MTGIYCYGSLVAMVYITVTSKWARWRLKSPAFQLFTQPYFQTQIKENTKAPRHWPLWGEFTGDRWIPRTKDQKRGKVSIWWRHHEIILCVKGRPNPREISYTCHITISAAHLSHKTCYKVIMFIVLSNFGRYIGNFSDNRNKLARPESE